LTTFIDHRQRAANGYRGKNSPAQSITDRSPKRCSTIPARRKDRTSGWGSPLTYRGRHRGGSPDIGRTQTPSHRMNL